MKVEMKEREIKKNKERGDTSPITRLSKDKDFSPWAIL
jgi:hypothetical protein